ncbi:MAG: HAD-IC family P-type ATPase, partial [Desulfonatronovibrionaceae bacterium]
MDRHHAHPADGNAWYAATVQETLDGLQTSYQGLTAAEAEKRLQKFGPNTLAGAEKKGPLTRFILQFHNILIYVLLAAAVITAFLQEWIDCLVIFGVTIINALIGFIQEGKAEKSLDSIRNMLAPRATVLRDGKKSTIPAEDLVPGDLILLQPGDRVPADLRLFELRDLQIDESALTGESVAVNKDIHALEENEVLAERSNMAFSGTMVTYGQGRGVVASTGKSTEIGRISSMLSRVDTLKTPLLKQMDAFGRKLTAAILVLAGLTFVFGTAIRDFGAGEMFLAAVGLAVAAIPEGLPAIMTITLAIGVQKMARRKAIIRRLPAVETLGSVTIICSDKTGTLTKNEMTVQNISTADRLFQITGAGYSPQGEFVLDGEKISPAHHPLLLQLLKATLLCNNATIQKDNEQWKVDGAPTEGALLTAAAKAGLDQNEMNKAMPRLDIIPFSSEKKFMATLNRTKEDKTEIILKGAPERILDRCTAQRHQDGDRPLDRGFWEQQGEVMASGGQRLLALAVKEMDRDRQDIPESDLEDGFVFLGLFGIIDPPREEAVEAAARLIGKCVSVHECHSAGIRVKMITGDHSLTALSIAKKLGIGDGKTALSGQDLEQMS